MSGSLPLDTHRFIKPPRLPLNGGVFLLLTAAGASSRFGGTKKELLSLEGKSILQRSLEAFLHLSDLAGIVVTYPEGRMGEIQASIDKELSERLTALPCGLSFVQGGATRQASVKNGLEALIGVGRAASCPTENAVVLVHDAARPWVAAGTIDAVLAEARTHGACVPLSDLPDTPKTVAADGFIAAHLERSSVKAAQTPQGFAPEPLAAAYEAAASEGWNCTDDSSLWDRYIGRVASIPGDRKNRKITYREDLPMKEDAPAFRIGEGWDIHPLVSGRRLLIGGIRLEHDKGEAGHSDGDVLWHAITDALIGALALGDIGSHFPPSDPLWKDADSGYMAALAAQKVAEAGWTIGNIDCTVILEKPRLGPQRDAIRASIASRLGILEDAISVKAKTNEGFGEIGEGNAIEARAVVLLLRTHR